MEKTLGQKITYAIAIACYMASIGCIAGAILYQPSGPHDAIGASLVASVIFFFGCGVVLHVIATTRLKGLISGRTTEVDAQEATSAGN